MRPAGWCPHEASDSSRTGNRRTRSVASDERQQHSTASRSPAYYVRTGGNAPSSAGSEHRRSRVPAVLRAVLRDGEASHPAIGRLGHQPGRFASARMAEPLAGPRGIRRRPFSAEVIQSDHTPVQKTLVLPVEPIPPEPRGTGARAVYQIRSG